MHEGQVDVGLDDLKRAIARQLPAFADLSLHPTASAGTVIAPYRLGADHLIRLPLVPSATADSLAGLREDAEHAAFLTRHLSIEVPRLVAIGEPFDGTPGYDGYWSVWTWLHGTSLDVSDATAATDGLDRRKLAHDLARLLREFHSLPTKGRAWNGVGRGSTPLADTEWVRRSIDRSAHLIDATAATDVWEQALAAPAYEGTAAYIHGDPMPGNFLVREGRLTGMVDIMKPSFGDPASDLAPAWTMFDEPDRSTFLDVMGLDDAATERSRGWAFEMAIGGLHYYEQTNRVFFEQAARTLRRLVETA